MRASLPFAIAAGLAACGDGSARPDAGVGPDAFNPADGAHGTDGAPLAWVDFTATGCALAEAPATIDGGAATVTCSGAAPLTVTFAPIASGAIDTWAWTFGDGAASSVATPSHTYVAPGTYDVMLAAAGPGGSASLARPGFLIVTPAPLGASCDAGAQCASGSCAHDLCVAACGAGCTGACAQLGGAWDATECVATCDAPGDCPTGRACEPVAAAGGGWISACVPPGALAPIGAACTAASSCATGDCLAIGARGACTVACGACPADTACAVFGNGTTACLPSCDAQHPCRDDPWIACESSGASGPWGFTASTDVCAPKSCSAPSDSPGGTCTAGHCGP
ncbi:MAG TPA: PKD domain-containing protein [Kofleriaceae bacterium]|nr:PKD domain-containing protein [Kofleriaceae bacterium]